MPVESVSKKRYRFVLMDDYSRASWVLLLRAKSDAPIEFKKWVNLMENGTDKWVKTIMFDNAKELTAGGMKEMCDERGISVFEWRRGTTRWRRDKCHEGHATGLRPPASLLG